MKYILITISLFFIGCSGNDESSIQENWYKGNLHTHTFWSDGDDFPERVIDWYKQNGYHFLNLSDHNTFQNEEKWVPVTKSPTRVKAFENYKNQFGDDWVETKEDSSGTMVKLKTFDQFSVLQDSGNFLLIRGEEITNGFDGKPLHVNASNMAEFIPRQEGGSVVEVLQNVIDAVNDQAKTSGKTIIPHINHPNFGWAISLEDMQKLSGERFFEVYNGHPAVNNYGDSARMGTEMMWDAINVAYINAGKPLMYGIATDDTHNYHLFGGEFSNAGRGWIMVNAPTLEPENLMTAMNNGNFYASTGVSLSDFRITSEKYTFAIKQEGNTSYKTQFIGSMNGDSEIAILKETSELNPQYEFTGDELFVRAVVVSDQHQDNPFQEGDFKKAWTQPVKPK